MKFLSSQNYRLTGGWRGGPHPDPEEREREGERHQRVAEREKRGEGENFECLEATFGKKRKKVCILFEIIFVT